MREPSPAFPSYSTSVEINPVIALLFLLGPRAGVRKVFRTWLPERGRLRGGGQDLVDPGH